MKAYITRLALILTLGLFVSTALAKDIYCSQCARKIAGNYVRAADGRVFCNRKCFRKTLPKCAYCAKPISGRYYVSKGRKYCSLKCYSHLCPKCELCGERMIEWVTVNGHKFCKNCASLPRCSECFRPFRKGFQLTGKRCICRKCRKRAIVKAADASKRYLQARQKLYQITGKKSKKAPKLKLIDSTELLKLTRMKITGGPNAIVRGFYQRTEITSMIDVPFAKPIVTSTRVEKTIFMLRYMTPENLISNSVHEHTHDVIAEFYPKLLEAPLWVQEGICQYTAAIYCREHKLVDQLQAIEQHPGEVYGDGYRNFKQLLGDDNWRGMAKWIKKVRVKSLPAKAPKKVRLLYPKVH